MPANPQKSAVLSVPGSFHEDKRSVFDVLLQLDRAVFKTILATALVALPIDARANAAHAKAEFNKAVHDAHAKCSGSSSSILPHIAHRYSAFAEHVSELVYFARQAFVYMTRMSSQPVTKEEQDAFLQKLRKWHFKFQAAFPSHPSDESMLPSQALQTLSEETRKTKQARKLARKGAKLEGKMQALQCHVGALCDPVHEAARIVAELQKKALQFASTQPPLTLHPHQCASFIYTARVALL
jgi:hypothetical protein